MQQQFILFIITLQYLLIDSQQPMNSGISIKLKFYYSTEKPLQTASLPVSTRLILKNRVNKYYFLTVHFIDDEILLVQGINCTGPRSSRGACRPHFQSSFIFFSAQELPEDYIFSIENDAYPLTKLLNRLSSQSFDGKTFNLTCVFIDPDGGPTNKPIDPSQPPLSNSNMIGIISLSAAIALVFVFCFGWFGIIYCRQCHQYRIKKKLRQALAQSTQEILDQSPIIIYEPTQRDPDQTDDEPMCSICLETFKSQENLRKLVCAHYFHVTCIDPWLLSHQSCPLCNRNILRNSIPSISSSIVIAINECNNDESTSIVHNENNQTIQAQN